MGTPGGISSTVAVDISAFGLGGPGMPGGPGGPPLPGQGGPQGPYGPGGMQQQPPPGYGQPQQQQGFPQQGGPGFPQQGGPYGGPMGPGGMQPMPPFQSPPAAPSGGNKTMIFVIVGVVVFLIALSVVAALVLKSRNG